MTQHYLHHYGFLVALALLVLGSILIFRAQFKLPSILIGFSSFSILILKILHEVTFTQEHVSYIYDEQGRVLGADIELSIWQSTSLWADPIFFITIAFGFLVISRQLQTLKN